MRTAPARKRRAIRVVEPDRRFSGHVRILEFHYPLCTASSIVQPRSGACPPGGLRTASAYRPALNDHYWRFGGGSAAAQPFARRTARAVPTICLGRTGAA